MNEENKPYKTIKQLLDEASLQPKENDWEKMQALLDKQMPAAGSGKGGFTRFGNWFIGGLLVLLTGVTIYYFVNKNSGANNVKITAIQEAKKAASATNNTNKNEAAAIDNSNSLQQTAGDSLVGFGKNKTADNADSFTQKITNATADKTNAGDTHGNDNGTTTDKPNEAGKIKNTTTKPAVSDGGYLQKNKRKIRQKTADIFLQKQKKDTQNKVPAEDDNSVKGLPGKDAQSLTKQQKGKTKDVANSNTKIPGQLADNPAAKPAVDSVQRAKQNAIDTTKTTVKKPITATLNNKAETAAATKKYVTITPLPPAKFDYGFQLSPIQKGMNAGDKPTLNPIPGFYANYKLRDKLNIGAFLLPYSNTQIQKNNSYFTTTTSTSDSVTGNASTTIDYLVKNLYTLKTGIHLGYNLSGNFSIEGGIGMYRTLGGKGSTVTTVVKDTLQTATKISSYRVHTSDSAFAGISKSGKFGYVNAWYNIKQWQLGVGYSQNFKSWFNSGSTSPSGQVQLNIRYNLNFRKEGR